MEPQKLETNTLLDFDQEKNAAPKSGMFGLMLYLVARSRSWGALMHPNMPTEMKWATASDGARVPISIVYRKNLVKLDGSDPLLLNGYGSHEVI
ncbi:hypothetical protein NC651_031159 [Populus alba x Populus x berolinensis]|nr:hypothetical protein NC651_031159 [Populus alba x Populus x berolinensis]